MRWKSKLSDCSIVQLRGTFVVHEVINSHEIVKEPIDGGKSERIFKCVSGYPRDLRIISLCRC